MDNKSNISKFIFRLLMSMVVVVLLGLGWVLWGKLQGEQPVIATDIPEYFNSSQELAFKISDAKSGIRTIRISIEQNNKEKILKDDHYPLPGSTDKIPAHEVSFTIRADMKKLGISDGKAIFHVLVQDNTWRNWFHGNKAVAR